MRWSYPIGQAFGIPIRIHGSLLIVLALITMLFSQGSEGVANWLLPLMLTLALFASVLVHELGHALVARRFDVVTRQILLLPIGGVAVLERAPEEPRDEFWIALAGPAASALLALSCWGIAWATEARLASHLAAINGALAVFNLIPAFPMDGGRILRAALAMRYDLMLATRWAARLGRLVALAFFVLGLVYGDLLLALVGVFVFFAAASETRGTALRQVLDSRRAFEIMVPATHVFGVSATSDEVVSALTQNRHTSAFAVAFGDKPLGVVERFGLERALTFENGFPGLHAVLDRAFVTITPDVSLRKAVEDMGQAGARVAIVRDEVGIIGLLRMDQIARLASQAK